jgi:hypothetical protein
MAFRAKHRYAALLRRAEQGRTIKSDLNPNGSQNAAYKDAKRIVTNRKRREKRVSASAG